MARNARDKVVVRLLDAMVELDEVAEFETAVQTFLSMTTDCLRRGGRIYVVCCGSSFHAAKAACLFFNEIAFTELDSDHPRRIQGAVLSIATRWRPVHRRQPER